MIEENKNEAVGVNVNEVDVTEVVAAARKKEADTAGERVWITESGTPVKAGGRFDRGMKRNPARGTGMEDLLDAMKLAAEEQNKQARRKARQMGWDSIWLGGLCALGVVSLVAAAVTGVWIPVAVGLGVCLSGAAAVLVYRGLVVLRR